MKNLLNWFPVYKQLRAYSRAKAIADLNAAVVVSVMLIPQSLAYAMLAGLPPHLGLYASVVPIVVYSLLGSSTALAVGPVAIGSIMTATTLATVTSQGLINYIDGAIVLALLSGLFMFILGLLRFGFVANFLSHSVINGFITASGIIIAVSQIKHLLGVKVSGHAFFDILNQLYHSLTQINFITLALGGGALIYLIIARKYAAFFLVKLGVNQSLAAVLAKMAPVLGVMLTTLIVAGCSLNSQDVAIVGEIPKGIANFGLPDVTLDAIQALILPAIFISLIGYVESISVGRTLAAKRNQKIDSNQELIGLGSANIASGLAGAFPITGGFSRSVVNFDAGAETQVAGLFTAVGIALAALFLTPYLYYLPIAMLASTIIIAVLSLVDFSVLKHAWKFSKSDFYSVMSTILITLAFGVEVGVATGIIVSIALYLYKTSRPHIAQIGLIRGTEHFRNIKHFEVEVHPHVISLRIDESLIFSNAIYLENHILDLVNKSLETKHLILHLGAVNSVDLTGMEMLEDINTQLKNKGILLHLSDVKIPIKKLLRKSGFLDLLTGDLFLSHYQAYQKVSSLSNAI